MAVLPLPPPRNCPHTIFTSGPLVQERLAKNAPRPACLSGPDVLLKRMASPGHAITPGLLAPQETVHTPRLLPGTVSPSSALSGHIEPPPSVAVRPLTLHNSWPVIGQSHLLTGSTGRHIWRPPPYGHSWIHLHPFRERLHGYISKGGSMSQGTGFDPPQPQVGLRTRRC